MEIKYYRDSSHNYLVIDSNELNTDNYQYKMIENNKIEGILPFTIRNMDGQSYIYYEIDSKQSLQNRYGAGRKMSYERLLAFIKSVVETSEKLGEYFLDEDHLIINSDCVFEDLSKGTFSFLYFPTDESDSVNFSETIFKEDSAYSFDEKKTGLFKLPDLILEVADMDDEKAAALAYRISERISEDGLGSIICIKDVLMEEMDVREYGNIESPSANELDDEDENDFDEEETVLEDKEERRVIKIRIPSIMSYFLAILFALVAGALWYLRMAYVLTTTENIMDIVVFMLSVMMSLICLIQGITKKKDKVVKDPMYVDDEDEMESDEYEDSESYKFSKFRNEYADDTENEDIEDDDNEETVFLNLDFDQKIHKLYQADGERGGNISLDKLPLTIGKLPDYADAVLREPTVSRIHAKIFKTGEDYYVQDLNSKNGTFVNGKRLMPNEKFMLFPEDEVTFGKCTFSYR